MMVNNDNLWWEYSTFGERLQHLRASAGYTQKELAEKSGLATGTIQQYELNKRIPRPVIRIVKSRNGLNSCYLLFFFV